MSVRVLVPLCSRVKNRPIDMSLCCWLKKLLQKNISEWWTWTATCQYVCKTSFWDETVSSIVCLPPTSKQPTFSTSSGVFQLFYNQATCWVWHLSEMVKASSKLVQKSSVITVYAAIKLLITLFSKWVWMMLSPFQIEFMNYNHDIID